MPRSKRRFAPSPTRSLQWFGGTMQLTLGPLLTTVDALEQVLTQVPRLAAAGTPLNQVGFPAGIVRGQPCTIRRTIIKGTLGDADPAGQTDPIRWAWGLTKRPFVNTEIHTPPGAVAATMNPLVDFRESWMVHQGGYYIPRSESNTVAAPFHVAIDVDTQVMRRFDENECLVLSAAVQGDVAQALSDMRLTILYRCLVQY